MKNYCLAAIGMMAIALGLTPAATATDNTSVGLDFSLGADATAEKADVSTTSSKPGDELPSTDAQVMPLAIPAQAPAAPLGSESKPDDTAKLPPPPEAIASPPPSAPVAELPQPTTPPAIAPKPASQPTLPAPAAPSQPPAQAASNPARTQSTDDGILSFEQEAMPGATAQVTPNPSASAGLSASLDAFSELEALFHGGTHSLVARAVGSAEGTRTPDGGKTRAYQGHVDPGNGVWNLGTFSYQHGAQSPEEADQRQLRRLRNQALQLRQAAQAKGLELTLEEELNGIDLANQSPRAALSRGGYIDRLHQAREMGLQGTDAVLWARTRSYLDPDSGRWNAPGLGNNIYSITNDQERRLRAIARAISASPVIPTLRSAPTQASAAPNPRLQSLQAEANVDMILSLDLP